MRNDNLQSSIQGIIDGFLKVNPVEATDKGLSEFDGLAPDFASESYEDLTLKLKTDIGFLSWSQSQGGLDWDDNLDVKLLSSRLESELFRIDVMKEHSRNAALYPRTVLNSLYYFLVRDHVPADERLENALSRLRAVPAIFEQGMANLRRGKNISPLWCEIGIMTCRTGRAFFERELPGLAGSAPFGRDELRDDILAANAKALAAFERFETFLSDELHPGCDGNFACGEEAFNFLLKKLHHLSLKADDLVDMGRNLIETVDAEMTELAAGMGSRNWREILADVQAHADSSADLIHIYADAVQHSRDFMAERDLVTVPVAERLKVIETPPFARYTTPFAYYMQPPAFSDDLVGFLWVTPPEGRRRAPKKPSRYYPMRALLIAVHEGYPGHHVQYVRTNGHERPVRKFFKTSVFVEGWALYCEEMVRELGLYTDELTRLMQLRDLIWRACRVVIDARLHTHRMTFDEAVGMLVETVGLEPESAKGEVRRYTLNPTQPMSYVIGRQQILELRDEMKGKHGGSFTLKGFHDDFLSYGTIPIRYIRDGMILKGLGLAGENRE